jgi:hypothetical protein
MLMIIGEQLPQIREKAGLRLDAHLIELGPYHHYPRWKHRQFYYSVYIIIFGISSPKLAAEALN